MLDRSACASSCIINCVTIHDLWIKFKSSSMRIDILLGVLIVIVAGASFLLGRLSVQEQKNTLNTTQQKSQLVNRTTEPQSTIPRVSDEAKASTESTGTQGSHSDAKTYVASKSGTKYHLPWCSGAKRIKEENKIYFATKEDAEKAGYSPAANCKGI